jgi:transcriptional regulator with PAS, ATPase and Fis domain
MHVPKMFFQEHEFNGAAQSNPKEAPKTQRNGFGAKPRKSLGLDMLNTGDPQIASVIQKVSRVLGRDIPILITGETGTGKELLAQAIHNDSPRNDHPFVAVNCASIPETLIESELFGYEEGAFTGAKRKGTTGKILQANGGTLFLDEIGDMPRNLQARLLRVLQERVVTPLGSNKSIPVNIALVCATNRDLKAMITKNEFREDLYYRLNGLVVKLPPLRDRSDLVAVVNKLLEEESNGPTFSVCPEVLDLFKRHSWPGNLRQLTNLLRTAMVMVGDDCKICHEQLPDDFIEDVGLPLQPQGQTRHHGATTEAPLHVPTAHTGASPASLEDAEIGIISRTLETFGGNVSKAARALGISRNTIYRKIASFKPRV